MWKWLRESIQGLPFYPRNLSQNYVDENENNDWIPLVNTAKTETILTVKTLEDIRTVSKYLYFTNYAYKGLVRNYVKYLTGKKFMLTSEETQAEDTWKEWAKKNNWKRKLKEIVRRFFRDGEVFIYLPTFIFIEPNKIRGEDTGDLGIIKDLDGNITGYSYNIKDSKYIIIEAKDIQHIFAEDENELRGSCPLFPLLKKSRQLDQWLNDRMLLNRIRSSIALIRDHKSSTPTKLKTFANNQVTSSRSPVITNYGESKRRKIPQGGTILDTSGIDYKFLSPNINANDVKEDGRNLGLAASVLTGFPEFMTRGDSSNSSYSSTMISEGPAEKEIEDWQEFFSNEITRIWEYILIKADIYTEDNIPECFISFPPVISRNAKEDTEKNKILHEAGVISTREWQRREQVDADLMDSEINETEFNIEQEEDEDEQDE